MFHPFINSKSFMFGPLANMPVFLMVLVAFWTVLWKGLALWKSSQAKQKYWFIALLIVNSLGILPIIYLAFFQSNKLKPKPKPKPKK
jgi:hypothetical protein